MTWWFPRALAVAVLAILVGEIAVVAPRVEAGWIVGAALWVSLPGVWLLRRALRTSDDTGFAWLFGPALGFALGVFGLMLWWVLGVQTWIAVLGAPLPTALATWAASRYGGPRLRLPALDRRDVIAVLTLLLIVPLVTWAPYDHVREPVPNGEAYRAYFTADFIWAMTVTSELAKGTVPPQNPFLADQPLHYYWMAHFLSGAVFRNVKASGVLVEQVVLLNGLLFGLAFVPFVYGLARSVGAGPWFAVVGVAAGFLANSYEGADMIRAIVQHGEPWSELTTVNIDAVSRWFYKGMAVDGLQRLLLYQPHHLTGYAAALAALWLAQNAVDITETSVALWSGILLALAVLFSTFIAIIVGVAVGLLFAIRLVQQRAISSAPAAAILGAAPIAVAVGISMAFGYTDQRFGFVLLFGLNPVAVHHAGRVLFLSFGPLLFAGVASLIRWRWLLHEGAATTALVLTSFAFYFFTNVPDSGDVWVGWRSGHLLLIAFAVMGAAALDAAWRPGWKAAVAVGAALALIPALPTVAIDVYNAQDITNSTEGAGFPWTTVITHQEREALEWIRRETPEHAVVQVEPFARGPGGWAYIPAFAQRRMVAGLPGSMTPLRPYREAADTLHWGVFRATSADNAYATCVMMKINYLALGKIERKAYRDSIAQIASRPDLFIPRFRNDEMTVFEVAPLK